MNTPCSCDGPTTAADLADVTLYRYHEPPPEECDHPVTVTRRLNVAQPIPGDPDNVRVIGQTANAVTACLDCHDLAPAQEETPAP